MKHLSQAHVKRRVKYWARRLRLGDVRFAVQFGPDPDPEDDSTAACLAAPEYEQALLRFDLKAIPTEEMESHVIHEILHYAVWPLSSFAHSLCGEDARLFEELRKKEEGMTTYIERLVLDLTKDTA